MDVIGQQVNGTWGYFGYDGLGSLRQITDGLGALQYAASYDPYGVPFETSGSLTSSLGYTGEFTDPNGLVYLRARYLQPGYGTFLSKDPFEGVMEKTDRVAQRLQLR